MPPPISNIYIRSSIPHFRLLGLANSLFSSHLTKTLLLSDPIQRACTTAAPSHRRSTPYMRKQGRTRTRQPEHTARLTFTWVEKKRGLEKWGTL